MGRSSYLLNTPFDEFDPNKMEQNEAVWAVYKGGSFKTYTGRGAALNSVVHNQYQPAKLYRRVHGRWELLAVKQTRRTWPSLCEVCHIEPTTDYSPYVWDRLRGKITDPPRLLCCCTDCKRDVARR